jgi:hypothetical protein
VTTRRPTVDKDGLTALGREWRKAALGHERILQAMMFEIAQLRVLAGEDPRYVGIMPSLESFQKAALGRCALCGQPLPTSPGSAADAGPLPS